MRWFLLSTALALALRSRSRWGALGLWLAACRGGEEGPGPPREPTDETATVACVPSPEIALDGIDNDCDGVQGLDGDADGDGLALTDDCDDRDAAVGGSTDEGVPGVWRGDVVEGDVPGLCEGFCRRAILGSLILERTSLVDLRGLECVPSITGDLRIGGYTDRPGTTYSGAPTGEEVRFGNDVLASLAGLEHLSSVEGDVVIVENPALGSLAGLAGLRTVGGSVTVDADLGLTSLAGLSLEAVGGSLVLGPSLRYTGLDHLASVGGGVTLLQPSSVDGLDRLASIGGDLVVSGGDLASLDGLGALTSLGGDLGVVNTRRLRSFEGLGAITSTGALSIGQCPALESLAGLDGVTEIRGDVSVRENSRLRSLDGLGALVSIRGRLFLTGNPDLEDLRGLDSLASVRDGVSLDHSRLRSLDGLEALTHLGSIHVFENARLTSVAGLSGVTGATDFLYIIGNDALPTLDGLEQLTEVRRDLLLNENHTLADATALHGLVRVGGDVEITGNYALGDAEAQALIDAIETVGGAVNFGYNYPFP